nr:exosortase F system-associated protein [Riemerella columbina]
MMSKGLRIVFVLLSIAGLISIRVFEGVLFYDPFLAYFKQSEFLETFPSFNWGLLVLNYGFRFLLNVFCSAVVVYALFLRRDWVLQTAILMTIVFLVALALYLYCIATEFSWGDLFAFYMRRFVIQPVILLLIIPMFYYRYQIHR